jgi:aldehyde dehydrogenase (NAD(P)+)
MSDLFVELTAPNGRKYRQPRGLFINNEFVKSKSGETITSINPRYITYLNSIKVAQLTAIYSDEKEIVSVYAANEEDVDDAVAAARKAFKGGEWRDMDTNARADVLFKFAQLIEEHRETLATIETWDNGKPYSVSFNDDLGEVIGTIKYYAGYANKIHGQVIDTSPAKLAYTLREPLGVCGQIIP